MKVLSVVRASTEDQEIESQKQEMLDFCKAKGFADGDIVWIAVAGASARKANKKYLDMLESIKNTIIADPSIKSVAFWHLNRLGRIESYIMQMKEWFVKNKIQVYVKNPALTLLKEDGSLDAGANIAWSVFASMVAYDTEEMFSKMNRGKARNKAEGKLTDGAHTLPIGYTVDDNRHIVPDWDNEAKVVQLVFNEYATGRYSVSTLCDELKKRGVIGRKEKPLSGKTIHRMLNSTAYLGKKEDRVYPAIISKDLWDKVHDVLNGNKKSTKETKNVNLAIKILKCEKCGYNYIANRDLYTCLLSFKRFSTDVHKPRCENSACINIEVMDDLLWDIASKIHIKFMNEASKVSIEECYQNKAILKLKRDNLYNELTKINQKKERAKQMYLDMDLTKEEYNKRLDQISVNFVNISKEIKVIEDSMKDIDTQIDNILNPDKLPLLDEILHSTPEQKRDIVQKHISKATVEYVENYKLIKVYLVGGEVLQFKYNYRTGSKKGFIEPLQ